MTDSADLSSFLERAPTPQEKALWDKFVGEYVKDFNQIQACIRCGFNGTFAREYAPMLMSRSYVQRKIEEYKARPPVDDEERLVSVRKRIEATFMAAMECGDPKVAVVAATRLGEMHGFMEAPDKSGDALNKLIDTFKDAAKALPD